MKTYHWLVLMVVFLLGSCTSLETPPSPPVLTPTPAPDNLVVLSHLCGDMKVEKLWVGEQPQGVFVNLNSQTTQGMLADNIRTLTMGDQVLWIGFAEGYGQESSVAVYDGSNIELCGNNDGIVPQGHVNAIEVGDDGEVWIGTDGQGVYQFTGYWDHYTKTVGLVDDRVYDLYSQPGGGVIAATLEGLASYDSWSDQWTARSDWFDPMIANLAVHAFLVYENKMLIGTKDHGLVVVDVSPEGEMDWELYTQQEGTLPSNQVRDLTIAPNRAEIWVAMDGGLSILDPDDATLEHLQPPNNRVIAVEFDEDGRPWIATLGGVFYEQGGEWHEYYTLVPTLDLALSKNNYVLIATVGNGLVIGKLPPIE